MAHGRSFGHYELRELLGRGGMGEVYRAFDPTMNRMVALKLLPPHLAGDPAFEQRFRREAVAAAALSDPHVIPIHSSGEIDGRLYVDMRLVEGPELHQLVQRGPLSADRAVKIIEQIAGALDAAHRVGLIHRDVKPSNIMIGPDDFAYLIDFGIAQAVGESRLTQAGEALGTLDYMAPERFDGDPATPSSGIYALACVLYQSLTGTPPFTAKSMQQTIAGHMMRPPPRPSDVGVSRAFDDVIARGLAKRPNQRYRTARQLASAARVALTAPAARSPGDQPVLDYDTYAPRRQAVSPWSPQAAKYGPIVPSQAPRSVPPPRRAVSVPRPPKKAVPVPLAGARPSPPNLFSELAASWSAFWSALKKATPPAWLLQKPTLIAIAVIVALVSFATPFALMGGSGEASEQSAAPLPATVLNNVMLYGYELRSIVGVADLTETATTMEFRSTRNAGTGGPCLGSVSIAEDYVYDGSGWTSVRTESFEAKDPDKQISQSATRFDSNEDASAFFTASRDAWRKCVDSEVTVYGQGKTWRWRAESVGEAGQSTIVQNAVLIDDGTGVVPDWVCPHAMAVEENVVVEAAVCSANTGAGPQQATRIVEAMVKDAKQDP